MMDDFDVSYKVYFLFSPESIAPIWLHSNWKYFSSILREQAKTARKPASVKSFQMQGLGKYRKFGRLTLSENSDLKWCPSDNVDYFRHTEISIPSQKHCDIELESPDLFIKAMNKGEYMGVKFSSALLMAFSQRKHAITGELMHTFDEEKLLSAARQKMNPFLVGVKITPWGGFVFKGSNVKKYISSYWWFDIFPKEIFSGKEISRSTLLGHWDEVLVCNV